jgi:hypothetical protein
MAATVLQYHDRNPYKGDNYRKNVVIFSATSRHVRQLAVMSPISLRVLLVLVAKLDGEGYAGATLEDLAWNLRSSRTYVNKGLLELARFDLIRKKRQSEYWINPNFFKPAFIEY